MRKSWWNTNLSPEITKAGYDVYSTVCIIRGHNDWLKQHRDMQQQTFLITSPAVAESNVLKIALLKDFFNQHVAVNESPESQQLWQVFDRTAGQMLPRENWRYEDGAVVIEAAIPWHSYTVSFLAWRIWEEISMYNHLTNNWDSEHLMQLDPVYPQAQEYLLDWMEQWCREHSDTSVVRFTSLFYNFTWIRGSCRENQNLFTDWGSYTFAVSPLMLENFKNAYGYSLTAEDFVNGGKYRATHMPPDSRLRDWINFICDFVADYARQLVDIVCRAMLRAPVERIGLGGYLHLVEAFPTFVENVTKIADEFRVIRNLHAQGAPLNLKPVVGILTAWGGLRSWSCCSHYHENPDNDLTNLIESLSGLPFDVRFLDFADIQDGVPDNLDVIVNAGFAGSAWSGGDAWRDERVVASLTRWVHGGGVLLGAHAPSAVKGFDTFFRLAQIFGVDIDTGGSGHGIVWRNAATGNIIDDGNIFVNGDGSSVSAKNDPGAGTDGVTSLVFQTGDDSDTGTIWSVVPANHHINGELNGIGDITVNITTTLTTVTRVAAAPPVEDKPDTSGSTVTIRRSRDGGGSTGGYSPGRSQITLHSDNKAYSGQTGGLFFLANEPDANSLRGVWVSGKLLKEGSDYTRRQGSCIINLLPTYLNTLQPGTYELYAEFADYWGTSTFTVTGTGQTAAPIASDPADFNPRTGR